MVDLSQNFTLESMVKSETATKMMLGREQFSPSSGIITNLKNLCVFVLQVVRDKSGSPINCSSGFRCPALNSEIGGSYLSDHLLGNAADIYIKYKYSETENFKKFRSYITGRIQNMCSVKVDLSKTSPNFILMCFLALNMKEMKIHQLIHENGDFGSPRWIHVSRHENNARNEIQLVKKGSPTIKRVDINDFIQKIEWVFSI
jgi:hypothetical protein